MHTLWRMTPRGADAYIAPGTVSLTRPDMMRALEFFFDVAECSDQGLYGNLVDETRLVGVGAATRSLLEEMAAIGLVRASSSAHCAPSVSHAAPCA